MQPVIKNHYDMSNELFTQVTYLLSAAKLTQLPQDQGSEVAFIGRSNAGKSSALNVITNNKHLARMSKTPGRTQTLNLFSIDDDKRLVDLPGYGFTKTPAPIAKRWLELVNQYLQTRHCLKGLILVMDIRHPLKTQDQIIIEWANNCNLPIHILLTKADKLNRGPVINTLQQVRQELQQFTKISMQLFSAHKKMGLDEIYSILVRWLV